MTEIFPRAGDQPSDDLRLDQGVPSTREEEGGSMWHARSHLVAGLRRSRRTMPGEQFAKSRWPNPLIRGLECPFEGNSSIRRRILSSFPRVQALRTRREEGQELSQSRQRSRCQTVEDDGAVPGGVDHEVRTIPPSRMKTSRCTGERSKAP